MSHAEIVALLTDIGARIESGRVPATDGSIVALDAATTDALRTRIIAAIVDLGSATRIEVEIGEVLVQGPIHGLPGAPVAVWVHGPYALDRIFPGSAAVLEIPQPRPRKT